MAKKNKELEQVDQNEFAAKEEKYKDMWRKIKKKLVEDPPPKPKIPLSRKPSSSGK